MAIGTFSSPHRCVADEQRALALGVQSFIFRLFGNIPGPIVMGVVFDLACLNFRLDFLCANPSRGNCWIYDNFQLSWAVLSIIVIGIAANLVFSFLTWCVYPKQNVSGNPPPTNQSSTELSALDADMEKTKN